MAFVPKKRKAADVKVDKNKQYTLKDASALVKEVNTTKFDASVDIHIRMDGLTIMFSNILKTVMKYGMPVILEKLKLLINFQAF